MTFPSPTEYLGWWKKKKKNLLLKVLVLEPEKQWIRKWIFYISPAKNSNPKWHSILKYSYYGHTAFLVCSNTALLKMFDCWSSNHSIHICIYNGNTYIFQILRRLLYTKPVLGELSAYDEPKCSAQYTVFSATAGHWVSFIRVISSCVKLCTESPSIQAPLTVEHLFLTKVKNIFHQPFLPIGL